MIPPIFHLPPTPFEQSPSPPPVEDASSPPQVSDVVYDMVVYPLGALIVLANLSGLLYLILAKYLRHPAYHYVASLAMADAGLGAYLILINAVASDPKDLAACLTKLCFIIMLCTGSIFSILSIAVDRYLFLVHAVHYYQWITFRYSVQLIVGLWVFASFVGFLPLFGYDGRLPKLDSICTLTNMAPPVYIIVVVVVYFSVPMLTITFLYGRILQLAIRQRRQLIRQTTPVGPLDMPRNSIVRRSGIALLRGVRAARVVLVIVGVFLATWMPFFVSIVVEIACGDSCERASAVSTYLSLLGFLNSLLNPCIYAYYGLDMKGESCSLCGFLCSKCRQTRRVEPQISWQGT